MFGNSLENLEKAPESAKTKISEIFRSLQKSSEKIGKCHKVLKTTFQHFNFFNSLEIVGGLWMSSEIFGKFRKFVAKTVLK